VNGSGVALPSEAQRDLENIVYQPCIGVLAVLGGEGGVPEPGDVQIGGEHLFFVSDNRRKGISEKTSLTIHAGPEFSREHAHTNDARVTQLLLEAAEDYLDGSEIEKTTAYRWVYSRPAEPHGEKLVYVDVPPPLLFCGDAYGGLKVEGAVVSGRAAAEKLLGAR
jgi:hypothetical protein